MTFKESTGDTNADLFSREGYLVVPNILSATEVSECSAEVRRLHEHASVLAAAGELDHSHFQREPFAAVGSDHVLPVLRKIEETGSHSAVFHRLAALPALIAIVKELLDTPDLLLFRSTLMLKPALHGSSHGLHQDSAYWPLHPPALVTVSIALTDASADNGCLKLIPRSHHWGLQKWGEISRRQGDPLTEREDVDLSDQIDVPLAAGSALFFHSLLVHGSGPNTTSRARNTALYAYFPPHVRYVPSESGPRERSFRVVAGCGDRDELTFVAGS